MGFRYITTRMGTVHWTVDTQLSGNPIAPPCMCQFLEDIAWLALITVTRIFHMLVGTFWPFSSSRFWELNLPCHHYCEDVLVEHSQLASIVLYIWRTTPEYGLIVLTKLVGLHWIHIDLPDLWKSDVRMWSESEYSSKCQHYIWHISVVFFALFNVSLIVSTNTFK